MVKKNFLGEVTLKLSHCHNKTSRIQFKHTLKRLVYSRLVCRKNFDLNNKFKRINILLKLIFQENGFIFINNDIIFIED